MSRTFAVRFNVFWQKRDDDLIDRSRLFGFEFQPMLRWPLPVLVRSRHFKLASTENRRRLAGPVQ